MLIKLSLTAGAVELVLMLCYKGLRVNFCLYLYLHGNNEQLPLSYFLEADLHVTSYSLLSFTERQQEAFFLLNRKKSCHKEGFLSNPIWNLFSKWLLRLIHKIHWEEPPSAKICEEAKAWFYKDRASPIKHRGAVNYFPQLAVIWDETFLTYRQSVPRRVWNSLLTQNTKKIRGINSNSVLFYEGVFAQVPESPHITGNISSGTRWKVALLRCWQWCWNTGAASPAASNQTPTWHNGLLVERRKASRLASFQRMLKRRVFL